MVVFIRRSPASATTVGASLGYPFELVRQLMALGCTGGTTNCGPAWASGAGSSYAWPSSLVGATWSDIGNTTAPTIALEAQ
jgi:hypothetical protein